MLNSCLFRSVVPVVSKLRCTICCRTVSTYDALYEANFNSARKNVLFPDINKQVLERILLNIGVQGLKSIRDVKSFEGRTTSIASFDSERIADEVINNLKGSLRTVVLEKSNAPRVQRKLNSKNEECSSQHLNYLRNLSLEKQIQLNHLVSTIKPNQIQDRFFVYTQFSEFLRKIPIITEEDSLGELFGSSISGFGSFNSDIDISFNLATTGRRLTAIVLRDIENSMRRTNIMFSSTLKILAARVQIVCFKHRLLPVNGDLATHVDPSQMLHSRLSFIYSGINPNISPVFSLVRQLLKHHGVTASYTHDHFTTFHVLIMYFVFLINSQVVPSVSHLFSYVEQNQDKNGSNLGRIDPTIFVDNTNTTPLTCEELFFGFFHFLAQFDFKNKCMDPIEGGLRSKCFQNMRYPVCVLNPVNADHNICKVVSREKVVQLQNLSSWIAKRPHRSLKQYFELTKQSTEQKSYQFFDIISKDLPQFDQSKHLSTAI